MRHNTRTAIVEIVVAVNVDYVIKGKFHRVRAASTQTKVAYFSQFSTQAAVVQRFKEAAASLGAQLRK
ncbi:MAG TPA: hypothetical protein VK638_44115 [Edaphobacter sp.]|nr:hypothetical protein [Edaphobacter sp.]